MSDRFSLPVDRGEPHGSAVSLFDRRVQSAADRLFLLAPPDTDVPGFFSLCFFDVHLHQTLLESVQRLRGRVYLHDGAITNSHLSADGLHETPEDDRSWHLVTVDARGHVTGCAWYREHDANVHLDRMRLRSCPLAQAAEWRDVLWQAVEDDIATARRHGLRYAEVGGWAVSAEGRRQSDGLTLVLAAYGLGRICGGALGITTATVRHASSNILCRLGGEPLALGGMTLPSYYDPLYDCTMEVLRFDSRQPNARFRPLVDYLHQRLATVPVIARPYWPARASYPEMVDKTRLASSASLKDGLSLSAC